MTIIIDSKLNFCYVTDVLMEVTTDEVGRQTIKPTHLVNRLSEIIGESIKRNLLR